MPTTRIPAFVLTDHVVELPLDHAAPDDGHTIEVFAREVVAPRLDHPHRRRPGSSARSISKSPAII